MENDPKMDFRYKMGDAEIEGYQITPASRYQQNLWPEWLVMQTLPDEMNALYSVGDGSDGLILCLGSGDALLGPMDWVVTDASGSLKIVSAMDMEAWVKVVPNSEPVYHPPADEIPDARPVVELSSVPVSTLSPPPPDLTLREFTEMLDGMVAAILLLKDGKTKEALEGLTRTVAFRTEWCHCAPGTCDDDQGIGLLDVYGCRKNSPLL